MPARPTATRPEGRHDEDRGVDAGGEGPHLLERRAHVLAELPQLSRVGQVQLLGPFAGELQLDPPRDQPLLSAVVESRSIRRRSSSAAARTRSRELRSSCSDAATCAVRRCLASEPGERRALCADLRGDKGKTPAAVRSSPPRQGTCAPSRALHPGGDPAGPPTMDHRLEADQENADRTGDNPLEQGCGHPLAPVRVSRHHPRG